MSKTALRSGNSRFERFDYQLAMHNSLLTNTRILFMKEHTWTPPQWQKNKEHGELTISVKPSVPPEAHRPLIAKHQHQVLSNLQTQLNCQNNAQEEGFTEWQHAEYIDLVDRSQRSQGHLLCRAAILGPHAIALSNLRHHLENMVYVGLLPAPHVAQIISAAEQAKEDRLRLV
jgi:hypothetical protein